MEMPQTKSLEFISVTDTSLMGIVAALAQDIWWEYYTLLIGVDQVEYMLKKFQSEEVIACQIRCEGFLYYLLKKNGHYVGYIGFIPRKET